MYKPVGKLVSFFFFFSSRRRHTRFKCDWSSDVCSSDLVLYVYKQSLHGLRRGEERPSQGYPVHRRQQSVQCWTWRESRRLHSVGRSDRQEGLGEQGGISELERRPGH